MQEHIAEFLTLPIVSPLTDWYIKNARHLPWRETKDAYPIWVSEIMLQQTRVEAVKPYYARFLKALPDVRALAAIDEDGLLKLWEGLGYYSRARNMQKAAKTIVNEYRGEFPASYDALRKLPGIGDYTAGAVASIAFGIPLPAVDGNVLRVLARLSNSTIDIAKPQARKLAERAIQEMIPQDDPGTFNQALMELGACVCLPNTPPKCDLCPLRNLCHGHRAGRAVDLPVKSKKPSRRIERLTVFVLQYGDCVAIRKRESEGLLKNMWEFPNIPGHSSKKELEEQLSGWHLFSTDEIARYSRKHVFTHVEWHMRVYALHVHADLLPGGWRWADIRDSEYALPTAFRICMQD